MHAHTFDDVANLQNYLLSISRLSLKKAQLGYGW